MPKAFWLIIAVMTILVSMSLALDIATGKPVPIGLVVFVGVTWSGIAMIEVGHRLKRS